MNNTMNLEAARKVDGVVSVEIEKLTVKIGDAVCIGLTFQAKNGRQPDCISLPVYVTPDGKVRTYGHFANKESARWHAQNRTIEKVLAALRGQA